MSENLWDHITPDMLLNGYQRWRGLDDFLDELTIPENVEYAPFAYEGDEGVVLRRKRTRHDKALLVVASAAAALSILSWFYR